MDSFKTKLAVCGLALMTSANADGQELPNMESLVQERIKNMIEPVSMDDALINAEEMRFDEHIREALNDNSNYLLRDLKKKGSKKSSDEDDQPWWAKEVEKDESKKSKKKN